MRGCDQCTSEQSLFVVYADNGGPLVTTGMAGNNFPLKGGVRNSGIRIALASILLLIMACSSILVVTLLRYRKRTILKVALEPLHLSVVGSSPVRSGAPQTAHICTLVIGNTYNKHKLGLARAVDC